MGYRSRIANNRGAAPSAALLRGLVLALSALLVLLALDTLGPAAAVSPLTPAAVELAAAADDGHGCPSGHHNHTWHVSP